MCNRILFIAIAGSLIASSQPLSAQESQLTVDVIATIDYPGSGNSTTVQGINDLGDVTGYFEDSSGATRSFIRYADGTFSEPIVEPNDVGSLTVARGINNLDEICGYYFSSDITYPYRGFILSGTTFTEYAALNNHYLTGITDAGDYCGFFRDAPDRLESFLNTADGGSVSWGVGSYCEVNAVNIHTGTVGNYRDSGRWHGYIRNTELPVARILYPIDYPGATDTFFYGLNDGGGIIVGKYGDSTGVTHGLIFQRPDSFTSFDYPGAVKTSLNGINNNQVVSGYYSDSAGIHHGFIGKVHE